MIDRRRLLAMAGSSLAVPFVPSQTFAQDGYPAKSIRLVIPRTPGGSVDVVGRAWSEKVRTTLGASHVENVGGGGGRIGADAVARAPADGYTLLIGTTSELVLNPLLAKQNYDPVKDFAPIGILSTSPLIIGLHPDVPANDLKELAEFMKANPDRANFGTAGANTIGHIAGEMFKQIAALPKLVHIPYKGGAAAMQDVMGGRLAFGIVSISGSVVDLHEAGKLKIIAVTSPERLAAAPKIPSVLEQGYKDMVIEFFIGLFAPSGVPPEIMSRLETSTIAAMKEPSLRKLLQDAGFEIPSSNRETAAAFVKSELARWAPVLKAAGLKQS